MEFMTGVYLFFILTSLYLTFLLLILHYKNKDMLREIREPTRFPKLSVLIPAWNEEETIGDTIQAVLDSDYPMDKLEIIVINDKSSDNTLGEMQKFKDRVKIINNEVNLGKASSLNKAAKIASGEIIAVVDADSYPNKESIRQMIAYFEEEGVGAVTSSILVKKGKTRLEKLQAVEYTIIAWNRKLLQFIEGIYVTPGPLSMYRKEAMLLDGGFDSKNITEDIEMTWKILKHGYKVRIDLNSKVYCSSPNRLRDWWKQRLRWNLGGMQTMIKYRKLIFNPRYGMMGLFVVPFFITTFFLSLVGLTVFFYILIKKIFQSYLMTKYAYISSSSFLSADALNLNANVFALFATLLIFFGILYLIYSQKYVLDRKIGVKDVPLLALYLLIYLSLYPFVLVHSIWRFVVTKKFEW
jgi:poly-beta-1,6-N-acetyl-D-glucosamine synthase